jgi:hypothetical protein
LPSRESPEQDQTPASRYPALDDRALGAIEGKFDEIVALLHGERLTELQRREMRLSLKAQIAASEALHRFKLANSDEPAFLFRPF